MSPSSSSASSRTSIRQVAARAGVSPKTVTNVMREREIVAPATKARVLQAVRELNYLPVRSANQNRHVETRVLSVLFDYDSTAWYGANAEMFTGLSLTAREHGYDLLVHLRRGPEWAGDSGEVHLLDRRSDGVILAGLREDRKVLGVLARHNIPTISCFNVKVPKGVAWVVSDNVQAMRLAVEHLASRGHSRIAHLLGPHHHGEASQRSEGFFRAMKVLGLGHHADCFIETDWEALPESETLKNLLKRNVTAVVCFNDSQALALWKLAETAGLQIPRDLSIIGMDDGERGAMRGLSTVTNPLDQISRAAVEAVLSLIKGVPAQDCRRTVPVELVARNSVAPPREYSGRNKSMHSLSNLK